MSAQSTAAIWNAATETFRYTQERFITDTGSLLPEDADAYLRALDEPYKRYLAAVWSPGATPIGIAYTELPKEERYDSEKEFHATQPPPPPVETPHAIDVLPVGATITKTETGVSVAIPGQPTTHHTSLNAWLHSAWSWLKHLHL